MSFKFRITVVVSLFTISLVWGFFTPGPGSSVLSSETIALEQFAEYIRALPVWIMFILILLKNVSAVFFSFIMSPLFLVVPVVSLVLNGWIIGIVSSRVITEQSAGYLLAGLLPHGIIELPAYFIGQAAAVGFGLAVMQAVVSKDNRPLLATRLKSHLKWLGIALILLIPAALIETFVTPLLLK